MMELGVMPDDLTITKCIFDFINEAISRLEVRIERFFSARSYLLTDLLAGIDEA